jgi:hypothetical protein
MSEISGSPVPADGANKPRGTTVTFDLTGLPRAGTATGVALASAAISVSAVFSRDHGPLDGSVFSVGLIASLLLIGVAVVSSTRGEKAADLVSWPGAAGAIGAGMMLAVLINDDGGSAYAGGGLALALGVIGYLAARSAAFAVTMLGALSVIYIQGVSDLTSSNMDDPFNGDHDNNHFMLVAAAVAVFVIVVSLAGWLLPRTRVLIGVLVGIGGLLALAGLMQVLMIARAFSAYPPEPTDSGMDSSGNFDDPGFDSLNQVFQHNPYRNDIYVVLATAILLGAFWICLSLATGHLAFRLLTIADAVLMVPMVMVGLVASHATWWAAGLAVVGVAALALTAYRVRAQVSSPR